MTIREFKEMIDEMSQSRMSLDAFSRFVATPTREDKLLREEYFPILSVVRHKNLTDQDLIELGNEVEPWDARINGADLYEIVQALPANEHEERRRLADGVDTGTRDKHINDHLQFPQAIIDAIDSKHAKNYSDQRTLIVAFDGAYAFEEDEVIHGWIETLRNRVRLGSFTEILLCDIARRKVFPLL